MTEDSRLVVARQVLEQLDQAAPDVAAIMRGVIAFAEERQRINLGLIEENSHLKRFKPVEYLEQHQEDSATASRDFGRGFTYAIRLLREHY
jgi:hypothetical protein